MPSEIESKPFYLSLSFWGLVGTIAAPILAAHGVLLDPGTFATIAVQAALGATGLFGVLRRKDIKMLPKL